MGYPTTPAEWQNAVDAAAGLRAIADCKMYGLLEGGPSIDVGRCDELLERGRLIGCFPSRPAVDLALGLIALINSPPAEEQQP
jgi:hypothetical protein